MRRLRSWKQLSLIASLIGVCLVFGAAEGLAVASGDVVTTVDRYSGLPSRVHDHGIRATDASIVSGAMALDATNPRTLQGSGGRLLELGAGDALGAITWTGEWSRTASELLPGDKGTMTLNQSDSTSVTGSYTWSGGGTITDGSLSDGGKTLTGEFEDNVCSGTFTIRLDGREWFQSYRGTFRCSGGASGSFTGDCIGGDCAGNVQDRWRWAGLASRKVKVRARGLTKPGRVYELREVRFQSAGTFTVRPGESPRNARGGAEIVLVYRKVEGRGPAKIRRVIRLDRFDARSFRAPRTGVRLGLAARVRSRFSGCRTGSARLIFFEAENGRDVVSLKLLRPCRVPGGLRAITYRASRAGQSAFVSIRARRN